MIQRLGIILSFVAKTFADDMHYGVEYGNF